MPTTMFPLGEARFSSTLNQQAQNTEKGFQSDLSKYGWLNQPSREAVAGARTACAEVAERTGSRRRGGARAAGGGNMAAQVGQDPVGHVRFGNDRDDAHRVAAPGTTVPHTPTRRVACFTPHPSRTAGSPADTTSTPLCLRYGRPPLGTRPMALGIVHAMAGPRLAR